MSMFFLFKGASAETGGSEPVFPFCRLICIAATELFSLLDFIQAAVMNEKVQGKPVLLSVRRPFEGDAGRIC